ncbi:hypothetical protein BKA62DRAFT_268226, partial [Auriculariales sp. MPI-PUGE-AT-0066]
GYQRFGYRQGRELEGFVIDYKNRQRLVNLVHRAPSFTRSTTRLSLPHSFDHDARLDSPLWPCGVCCQRSATLWCQDLPVVGAMTLHKNNATSYPLGLLSTTDGQGHYLFGVTKEPTVFLMQACDSVSIGKPGLLTDGKSTATVYGKIVGLDTSVGPMCISRLSDGRLAQRRCQPYDGPEQGQEFFRIPFKYTPGQFGFQAQNLPVTFAKGGYFNMLSGGVVYETSTKPKSTWTITWSFHEPPSQD